MGDKTKNPNLKTRIYQLFKSSACSLTAKTIPDNVEAPVFLASNTHHSGASSLFNLHRSISVPYFSDDHRRMMVCPPAGHFKNREEERRVFYDARGKNKKKKKKKKKKNNNNNKLKLKLKLSSNPYGFTSSSSFSCDDGEDGEDGDGVFSSDDREEETETLFSSRSFSSDSSDFYYNSSLYGKKKGSLRRKPPRRGGVKGDSRRHDCSDDGFRPLVSISSTKKKKEKEKKEKQPIIRDGVPVVKETAEPYADFRISMLEMIFEKQIFGKVELDRLLRSFLSLNSHHHHSIIMEVFSDICEVLFIN